MIVMALGGECYCRNRIVEIGRKNVSSSFSCDVLSRDSLYEQEVKVFTISKHTKLYNSVL